MTVTHPRPLGRSAAGPAAEALARARDHLLGLQHDQGWWQGELETNVTMDAEDLLLREFLGVRTPEQTQAAARWIASQQRDDGTWANFYGGPGDLSTTVEAYVALRLAGHEPQAPHLARAAAVDPRPGRDPGHPGVHPDLARPVRPVVLGRPAGDAAGADLPARVVPVQHLRLGLLGAADHRAAHRRGVAPASHAASVWAERTVARRRPG